MHTDLQIQQRLNALGFGPLREDNDFGPVTKLAVQRFQAKNGLVPDGVVGKLTDAALFPPAAGNGLSPQRWPKQSACDAFYGNPRLGNAGWQLGYLVRVPVPWQMAMGSVKVSSITIHRKCSESLSRILEAAWAAIGRDQAVAHRRHWDVYSGSYNFRPIRGSSRLSMHAYGCAIDFDAPCNQLGSSATDAVGFRADDPLVEAFEAESWVWGGRWTGRSDPMHFQAATV